VRWISTFSGAWRWLQFPRCHQRPVLDFVEKVILFYREEGAAGERFADMIDRLGFDYLQDRLLHTEPDKSKILQKKVTGGATC